MKAFKKSQVLEGVHFLMHNNEPKIDICKGHRKISGLFMNKKWTFIPEDVLPITTFVIISLYKVLRWKFLPQDELVRKSTNGKTLPNIVIYRKKGIFPIQ